MQQFLIEEAMQRATDRAVASLTLIQLSFEAGLARASEFARRTGRVIDPVATCCYGEARDLLLRPEPNFGLALAALSMAARREPRCYGSTYVALHKLLIDGLQRAVDVEFEFERERLDEADEQLADDEPGERSKAQ